MFLIQYKVSDSKVPDCIGPYFASIYTPINSLVTWFISVYASTLYVFIKFNELD